MTVDRDLDRTGFAPVADPAPLGLGAFALAMFLLSIHFAGWAPNLVWLAPALYCGLAMFLAGMWEYRNRNPFGATMFATYAGFFWSLAGFTFLGASRFGTGIDQRGTLAWIMLAFAIFTGYMLLWSSAVNVTMVLLYLAIGASLVLYTIGLFMPSTTLVHVASWVGLAVAAIAWYSAAAGIANRLSLRHHVLPLGGRLWSRQVRTTPDGSPLPGPFEPHVV